MVGRFMSHGVLEEAQLKVKSFKELELLKKDQKQITQT